MSTRNKIILNSMDSVFKHILIDPDLPDPATYDGWRYTRPIIPTAATWHKELHASSTDTAATYTQEHFVKQYMVEPTWGERFFYWKRCD